MGKDGHFLVQEAFRWTDIRVEGKEEKEEDFLK